MPLTPPTCLVKAKANRALRMIFGSSSVAEPCLDKTRFPSPPSPRDHWLPLKSQVLVSSAELAVLKTCPYVSAPSQAYGGGSSYSTDKGCWLQSGHRQGDQGCTRLFAGLTVLARQLFYEHYIAASWCSCGRIKNRLYRASLVIMNTHRLQDELTIL